MLLSTHGVFLFVFLDISRVFSSLRALFPLEEKVVLSHPILRLRRRFLSL
jgi:hypothetical protein